MALFLASKLYDIIVLGAGPGGITSAIYSARKKFKTLVISGNIGGQAALSSEIENYTSYHLISGLDLARRFEEHLESIPEIEHHEGELAVSIQKISDGCFEVKTNRAKYCTKAIIISTGARPKKLGVPGEDEYASKGVFYCATCDGPLFANKVVGVIGGGNSAMDAALQLTRIAKKVFLVTIHGELRGDKVMEQKILAAKNVEVIYSARTTGINGEKLVSSFEVESPGGKRLIDVSGIFIEIGYVANTDFLKGFVQLNEWGEIITNKACETSVPGVFAAGDCTSTPEKQIIIAAGEGAVAALSAARYLGRKKE